jgi:hypothetical protein
VRRCRGGIGGRVGPQAAWRAPGVCGPTGRHPHGSSSFWGAGTRCAFPRKRIQQERNQQ